MNRLKSLKELNSEVNRVLERVNYENNLIIQQIREKSENKFNQFLKDMEEIKSICAEFEIRPKIDTGVYSGYSGNVYLVPYVAIKGYAESHYDFGVGHWFSQQRKEYHEGNFKLEKSFDLFEENMNSKIRTYIIEIIDNWEEVYENMINSLSEIIKEHLKKKVKNANDRSEILLVTLNSIS